MTSDEYLDQLEEECLEQLAILQQQYSIAAKPIVDRLLRIRDLRPHKYIIPLEAAVAAGLIKDTHHAPG